MSATEPAAQLNLHEAKTHLSHLVERAAAGKEIIISKAGQPMARLGAVPKTPAPRRPGRWRGRVVIHDDFDELPPEIAAAFHDSAVAAGREIARGDRVIGMAASQAEIVQEIVHQGVVYDLQVDTTHTEALECARAIAACVQ